MRFRAILPRFVTLLFLLASAVPATRSAPVAIVERPSHTSLSATPHVLDPERPGRRRFGELTLEAGWRMTSADARFGGLSAMTAADGGLLALSDSGSVFRIALAGDRPARLEVSGLPAGPGDADRKSDRDTEALTRDPATGRLWIAFEQHHQVWRYGPAFGAAEVRAKIAAPRRWRMNGGVEAMTRLPDGRFVMFSETRRGPGGASDLLVYPGDPTAPGATPRVLAYLPPGPLQPTDAAVLSDGRILVLHRFFSLRTGVWAMLGVVEPEALNGTAPVRPRVLASWGPGLAIDNMEALAVTREGGRDRVWIASDDNFTPLQRTLLLRFRIGG